MFCLVIGATGYVGARLVPKLLAEGHAVRCLVRDERKLASQAWADAVDARRGDMSDPAVVSAACRGVDAVIYLVHAMESRGFADRDRAAARLLADAAADASRVVYLGGLQPAGNGTSEHLGSRREVGEILIGGAAPAAVVQAGIVIGSGSASFELIRHLAEAAPRVLPLPDHAWNAVQPIGIDDLLHHLVACLDLPADVRGTFDVGGPDVLSYRELISGYAAAAGLRTPMIVPVPVSTPRLSARAVQAITPVDRHLAGPLFESMAYDLVCRGGPPDGSPPGGPTSYREAVRRAIVEAGAAGPGPTDIRPTVLASEQTERACAPASVLWEVITGLGGDNGWFTVPGAWAARGMLDRMLGGVGARRIRPERLEPGAAWDWWRIEQVEVDGPIKRVLLRAETRLPGVARLEMRAEQDGERSRYVQRVTFRPRGPAGHAYWRVQGPVRDFVFAVTARTVVGVAAHRAAARRRE